MLPIFRIRRSVLPILFTMAFLCGNAAAAESAASPEDRQFARYKFLLIDDEPLVERHNLRRKVNQAVKQKEPVLRLDAPWETDRDMLNYVSVMYDEEEQIFKMWYTLMRWQGVKPPTVPGAWPTPSAGTASTGKNRNWAWWR